VDATRFPKRGSPLDPTLEHRGSTAAPFHKMSHRVPIGVLRTLTLLTIAWLGGRIALAASPDLTAVRTAGTNASSVLLDAPARAAVANTFLDLVRIKGVSGEEHAIRDALRLRLIALGATNVPLKAIGSNVPANLALVIPATGSFTNQPGILLNAHIDTIVVSTPEHLAFDPATGDFHHALESDRSVISSFGGDDRSGVTVIVSTLEFLHARHWSKGRGHRRIVVLFTADEERGCVGAKYLARRHPELFDNLEITLSIDGPLDLQTRYPEESLVTVVPTRLMDVAPYSRTLGQLDDYCRRAGLRSRRTEVGLGMGDFAYFPPEARAQLHLRSPVRGWHNRERVKVQDLITHTDLLATMLLDWDR